MSIQAGGGVRRKKLLLLDTGDNCRCPMAEGYLKKLLFERGIDWIDVSTAGVMTPTGLLPTPEAEQLLKEEGVDISRHRSRPMKAHMLEEADLVLGMSSLHVQKAIRETEAAKGKTFLLREYVGYHGKQVQIPDPMGGTMDAFKRVFDQLKDALEKLVETDFIRIPPPGWKSASPGPEEIELQEEESPLAAEVEAGKAEALMPAVSDDAKLPPAGQEEPAVGRRKRGRPRKVDTGVAIEAPAPRKRGRPRKATSAEASPPSQLEKKRRGRPPKSETDKKAKEKSARRKVQKKSAQPERKTAEAQKKKPTTSAKTQKPPQKASARRLESKSVVAKTKGAQSRRDRRQAQSRKK
ncbi:MAG: hypothetical protein N2Z21_10585 [Candidatus Sumerlaeaceae bacterium]|nr:hypothetical protein [Candidatus Sumerlaeaceae bacterium]